MSAGANDNLYCNYNLQMIITRPLHSCCSPHIFNQHLALNVVYSGSAYTLVVTDTLYVSSFLLTLISRKKTDVHYHLKSQSS